MKKGVVHSVRNCSLFPNMCFAQHLTLATNTLIYDCLFQVGHTRHIQHTHDQHLDIPIPMSAREHDGKLEVDEKLDASSERSIKLKLSRLLQ